MHACMYTVPRPTKLTTISGQKELNIVKLHTTLTIHLGCLHVDC